jgi:hypothetical protein
MTNARKSRGMATQQIVCDDLRSSLWPWCVSTGAGLPGADLQNTPGVSVEIKARREIDIIGWLRQARSRPGLTVVIFRPDGYGPATLDEWPVVHRYGQWKRLMARAGYGPGEARSVDQEPVR